MKPLPASIDPSRWHITPPPGEWRKDGACHNQPYLTSELFFPPGEDSLGWSDPTVLAASREAKAICSQCPVVDSCGEYSFQTNQPYGVWGGMTPPERKRERRQWAQRNRSA